MKQYEHSDEDQHPSLALLTASLFWTNHALELIPMMANSEMMIRKPTRERLSVCRSFQQEVVVSYSR